MRRGLSRSALWRPLLAGIAVAALLVLVRVVQSHEQRLVDSDNYPAPSIANQVCADDPQSCAAKTYFPPYGP